ncbi:MAG: cytochrome-c oxidase, cbb3-type subunit III [Gammaproteobacteria bacterium]
MADFTNDIVIWVILIGTIGGILGMAFLAASNSSAAPQAKEGESMGHVWDETLEELNNPLPRWWLMMFYITIVFGVIYLALYPGLATYAGVLGWSSKGQYETEIEAADANYAPLFDNYLKQDPQALAANADAMRTGERLFVNYCSVCHGSDARGAKGFPNLRDSDWLYGGSAAQIKHSILLGRNGVMPAWGGPLGGEKGVDEMTHYVMSLSGREVDEAKAAAAKPKFAMCAGCHGADGKGNPALGAPNLTDNVWLYGGSPKAIAKSIAEGRQGKMPAHKEFLGEAKSHVLAAYVYSLSQE